MPPVRSALRRGPRHRKRRATPLAAKIARPYGWGKSARPGALRRLPDVPQDAARRACPGGPICRHEMGQYQGGLV